MVLEGAEPEGQMTDAADSHARRLARAQQSTAGRPVPSVREARHMRAAEEAAEEGEARVQFERGLRAEEAGNLGAAKAYYRLAARRATGQLQDEIRRRLDAVKRASNVAGE